MKKQELNSVSMHASPHMDRWHYLDYRDGKHDDDYVEWKYFNFLQGKTAGYIIYYVLDPELKTSLGPGRLVARILNQGKFYGGVTRIPMDNIEFDTQTAGIRMGNAFLEEKSPYRYAITGNVGGVSWNLNYVQRAPTVDAFNEAHVGIFLWEKISWLVKMPRADVTGTIMLDGATIPLNALGYSDSNWGETLPFLSRYEWGQFNDEKISIIFGVVYKWWRIWRSYVYVIFDRQIISFEGEEFVLLGRAWGKEEFASIKTPKRAEFEIKKGPYVLRCSFAPVRNDTIALRLSPLLPKPYVIEQISSYEGAFYRNGKILHRFSGLGFSEYSTKTWRSVPVTL